MVKRRVMVDSTRWTQNVYRWPRIAKSQTVKVVRFVFYTWQCSPIEFIHQPKSFLHMRPSWNNSDVAIDESVIINCKTGARTNNLICMSEAQHDSCVCFSTTQTCSYSRLLWYERWNGCLDIVDNMIYSRGERRSPSPNGTS